MQVSDLDFQYPSELVATEPQRPSRVAYIDRGNPPTELTIPALLEKFRDGDLLVVNESKVVPARIFTDSEAEILFLQELSPSEWQVLFPARDYKVGDEIPLPGGVTLTLTQKGLPQIVQTSIPLEPDYFVQHGEIALPPYIQEARSQRRNLPQDREWYQTAWAKTPGSVAAPTASLHFSDKDLIQLRASGVTIQPLTLHVGAGTFLPIRSANLNDHTMHAEAVTIPASTLASIRATKESGGRVWALGTTVARSLEAWASGDLFHTGDGDAMGHTKLFIRPPYEFKVVDILMTNFHQPRSTLISLVAAFSSLAKVREVYSWAIEKRFRLFSYGDLSVWIK